MLTHKNVRFCVQGNPYDIVITKTPATPPVTEGDQLTCAAKGLPTSMTYQWLNETGYVIGTGDTMNVTSAGANQNVQCEAENLLGNTTASIYGRSELIIMQIPFK